MHTPCPFINQNGSCSLPTCFQETCESSSATSSVSLFMDTRLDNGVFKVHIPKQSRVLYVPPVATLLDSFQQPMRCHVVSSWWWSEKHTLFIQVYMQKCSPTCAITKWKMIDFPLTCVDDGGDYQIHTLRCQFEKTKRKTE